MSPTKYTRPETFLTRASLLFRPAQMATLQEHSGATDLWEPWPQGVPKAEE